MRFKGLRPASFRRGRSPPALQRLPADVLGRSDCLESDRLRAGPAEKGTQLFIGVPRMVGFGLFFTAATGSRKELRPLFGRGSNPGYQWVILEGRIGIDTGSVSRADRGGRRQ